MCEVNCVNACLPRSDQWHLPIHTSSIHTFHHTGGIWKSRGIPRCIVAKQVHKTDFSTQVDDCCNHCAGHEISDFMSEMCCFGITSGTMDAADELHPIGGVLD